MMCLTRTMSNLPTTEYDKESIAKGKLPKRKLKPSELIMIKRSLNLRATDPFPKCPARCKAYVRNYECIGDYSHTEPGHRCELCQCQQVAGYGTDHLGYGLCYSHERSAGYRGTKDMIANNHKIALQQNNPRMNLPAEKHIDYLDLEGKNAARIANQMNMLPEAEMVKSQVQSFYRLMSEWEGNEGFRNEAYQVLHDISARPEINDDDRKVLADIRDKMVFPLTERGGKEMSGEVRYKLLTSTLKDLTDAMRTLQDILDHDSITSEAFKVWMGRVVEQLKKEFEEQHYMNKEHQTQFRIIEGIAECFRRAGDPRRGKN